MATDADRRRWDERYAAGAVWGLEPNRFVVEAVEDLEPGTALDLGSGQGRNALWLASRGWRVHGVDLSPVAVEQAQRLAEQRGLPATFEAADLTRWDPGDDRYDLVLLAYLQVPPDDRRLIHQVARRALAPGGRIVIVAHHRDNLEHGVGGPPVPELLFTEDDVRADLGDIAWTRCGRVLRPVPEADRQAIDLVCIGAAPDPTGA